MFKTIHAGRLFGIDLYLHWTLWPLLIYVLMWSLGSGSASGVGFALSFLLIVFVSVYLHELGHALTARRLGIQPRDIVLMPLGGMARFEATAIPPRSDLWIAAAGPLVNLALAAIAAVPLMLTSSDVSLLQPLSGQSILLLIVQMNLILGVTNLLPAMPLDGGRILRAGLSLRLPALHASAITNRVSRYVAAGLMIVGLFYSTMLLLFGLFIFVTSVIGSLSLRAASMLQRNGLANESGSGFDSIFGESQKPASHGRTSGGRADVVDAVEVRQL